jgi:hypothetical protein
MILSFYYMLDNDIPYNIQMINTNSKIFLINLIKAFELIILTDHSN